MKRKLIAIFLIFTFSCKSELNYPLIVLYQNDQTILNLELETRDKNNYYGVLKIANVSQEDLSFMVDKNYIFLVCDGTEYISYQYGGALGIGAKLPLVYLKKDKILFKQFIIESSYDLFEHESCIIEVRNNPYKKIKLIDKSIPAKQRKLMINDLMRGKPDSDANNIVITG
jgi:hypothetical protein